MKNISYLCINFKKTNMWVIFELLKIVLEFIWMCFVIISLSFLVSIVIVLICVLCYEIPIVIPFLLLICAILLYYF